LLVGLLFAAVVQRTGSCFTRALTSIPGDAIAKAGQRCARTPSARH